MNLNFCRHKCGKSWHPKELVHLGDGRWFLVMHEEFHNSEDGCGWLPIEDASSLFGNPPDGWILLKGMDGEFERLVLEGGNAEDAMWMVRLKGGDGACKYVTEHTMYDIRHERRMEEWRLREARRMEIIEERKANAEADSEKLP